jgi:hypothetical protein
MIAVMMGLIIYLPIFMQKQNGHAKAARRFFSWYYRNSYIPKAKREGTYDARSESERAVSSPEQPALLLL